MADELVTPHSGVLVSITIEAVPFGDLLVNGREAGAYVLGYWNRHIREIPDGWEGEIELLAVVNRDHLAAVLATLVQAGANAQVHTDDRAAGLVTLRFFVEVAVA